MWYSILGGQIDPRYHRILPDCFEWQQKSDYDVYWLATKAKSRQRSASSAQEGDVTEGKMTFLTEREAAEYLGVSLYTLTTMESDGCLIPFRTLGGHCGYSLRMLNEYLEKSYKPPHHQESENESEVRDVSLLSVPEIQDQSSPPIDVLNLSFRSYSCLQRSGLQTIAQVAALSDEGLLAIRQLGPKALAEIREKLTAYLTKHPLPDEVEESLLEPEVQAVEPLPPEPPPLPPDPTPVDVLGLSIRPYNALRRSNITTIGHLAEMSDEEVKGVQNIGPKSLTEIKDKLKAYLAEHPLPDKAKESPLEPEPQAIEPPPSLPPSPPLDPTPMDVLGLSIRPYNALRREDITTIGQLARMSDEEIRGVRNIGPKSLAEIKNKLKAYLAVHPLPTKPVQSAGKTKPPPPPLPLADPKVLSSAQEKGVPLDEISAERLALPESLQSLLQRASIQTIGDLAQQPREKWAQYVDIVQRLNRYLTWLIEQDETAWADEVAGRGISPIYRLELAETSLETLIEELLSPLTSRQAQVIRWRYGLDGEELNLGEVGDCLGLTRERVRQIQNKALDILKKSRRRPIIRLLSAFMLCLLEQAGGLMNEVQVEIALRRELAIGNVNPVGVARLVFTLDANVKQFRKAKAWGLRSYPLDEVKGTQTRLARVLEEENVLLSIDELIARFKSTQFYLNRRDTLKDRFILACLRVHPAISVDQDNQCGLTKWERHRTDKIVLALREIGEPAHYTFIAGKANELSEPEMRTSAHNIHAILGRRTDLFVRVGHGIFGLKEWGLPDDGSLANAAYRVLTEANKPLHINVLTDKVLETWQAQRISVFAAVENDDRFCKVGYQTYWLKERIAQPDRKDGSSFSDTFGRYLKAAQDRSDAWDKECDYDGHDEVEKLRRAGTDLFSSGE